MNRHWICHLAVVALAALFLLGMGSGNYTVYLPLTYRQPTPTPTLMPGHYYLSGRVFFDYNGSGLQEEGEPGIQGVPVYVDSLGSALLLDQGQRSAVPPGYPGRLRGLMTQILPQIHGLGSPDVCA